ncbi:hypothetical protein KEM60_01476 [Austwickia sp. TVS 96-490-7B]|uniref:anchored repeat ABC transporter, substrate-binding protein n=1 Tax=Austwickia sp. TVS 96-490-7B TaxID=2830843 RepID=UPI001C591EDA|nr:anchored repeat ABC transporter, substrate-binding protein [Austwickia sp. TVS 96-490-7B]MBW3085279.1 hypothetical protein [Austwickia sp. TVS 96-490-7B]
MIADTPAGEGRPTGGPPRRRRRTSGMALLGMLLALTGCAVPSHTGTTPGVVGSYDGARPVRVVATTPLIADIVRNVGGDRVQATAMVPIGADPHAYEPGLRAIRDVAYADLALSNYLMLEEHSLIQAVEANIAPGVRHVSLAEGATRHGGQVISLTENAALDTVWLGLRVVGTGQSRGATRASSVRLRATDVEGPGALSAYVTETFGNPRVFFDSGDGITRGDDASDQDSITLPVDAHTHMSWAFTAAGIYRLHLKADLITSRDSTPVPLGTTVVTFAVGVDPHSAVRRPDATVLTREHADLGVDVDTGTMVARVDPARRPGSPGGPDGTRTLDPANVVIDVPTKALAPVPADPAFRFIARPGTEVYQLPQAVLGRHVHGQIDPHLWMDVRNVKAYAHLIRDELQRLDPPGSSTYREHTDRYLRQLDDLDAEVARELAAIPPQRRHLVTTHDSFGYLSHAYDLPVAGVVTPSPATEPSVADRSRLVRTLKDLAVPAVFVSPTELRTRSVLVDVARDMGLKACPLLSDSFTPDVHSYIDLMRFDARSLRTCLT